MSNLTHLFIVAIGDETKGQLGVVKVECEVCTQ